MMTVVCKLDTANKESLGCLLEVMCVRVCHYARSRIKSITRQRGELSRRGAAAFLSCDRAGFDFVLTLYRPICNVRNLFSTSRGLEKLLITRADVT
jgi:hypothetical protein